MVSFFFILGGAERLGEGGGGCQLMKLQEKVFNMTDFVPSLVHSHDCRQNKVKLGHVFFHMFSHSQ